MSFFNSGNNFKVTRQAGTTKTGAYAEALQLIEMDKKEKLNMLNYLEKEIARADKSNAISH